MTTPAASGIQVGLVGCGSIAQIAHLPTLKKLKGVELVALCDADIRKASILADRFSIPNVFGDIEEMFQKCKLDAVFILTPNNLHLPMSLIALENGAHVFVERPAARNAAETRRIADAAKRHDRKVLVGMHTRFRRDIMSLKGLLDRKIVGDIFFVKAEWFQARLQAIKQPWWLNRKIAGGGVLIDLGIQLLDASWWLLSRPKLKSVKAHKTQINSDINVEDFCSVYMEFTNGLKLAFDVGWSFPLERDRFHAELFGNSGTCTLNPFRVQRLWKGKTFDETPNIVQSGRILFKRAYETEISHFIGTITGTIKDPNGGIDDAVHVMEMIDAIYRSLETGREVVVNRD